MNEEQVQSIVEAVLAGLPQAPPSLSSHSIPIEASARHAHLSNEAFIALFGPGAQLTQTRALSQPGEFLSGQRVNVITSKGMIENVAILGPLRQSTQVELSLTDCRKLGIQAPMRLSGDLRGAADVLLVGPAGIYEAKGSTIIARNHIHMTPGDASRLNLRDGSEICIRAQTARPVIFEQVIVRISDKFKLAMHVDFDEANACMLEVNAFGVFNGECKMRNAEINAVEAKVITEAMAKELCNSGIVHLRKGTIITPSARDIFQAAKCSVNYI